MDNQIDSEFWVLYEQVFERAKEIVQDRKGYYHSDKESIFDYWVNGTNDIEYELNKKLIRFRRILKASPNGKKTIDKVDDTLIDLINYAAFAYAYIKIKGLKNNVK